MTTAEAILTDLLADESDWWAGELQTVTGYYFWEYRELAKRMNIADYQFTGADRRLLYGAAMGLIYCDPPHLDAFAVRSLFGDDWVRHVEEFILVMRRKK